MLSSLFDSTSIPILEQVIVFNQTRHEVLAGNIANLDTPGYKIRDISPDEFQSKLKEAIELRDTQPSNSPFGNLAGRRKAAMAEVRESMQSILYHDGSDVGLEYQVAEISKNQAQHNMALAIMKSQLSLMQAAISERA